MNQQRQRSLHDLGFSELVAVLAADGVILHHAKVLWRVIHGEGELDLAARDFLPPLKRWVAESVGEGKAYFLDAPEVVDEIRTEGQAFSENQNSTCAPPRSRWKPWP